MRRCERSRASCAASSPPPRRSPAWRGRRHHRAHLGPQGARGERIVYRASEGIGVTLHQPEKAGELVSAAIAAGATGVSGPNFFVGDTESAFAKALAAAFAKAKARATTLATAAGATLGPAITIDEGEGAEFVPRREHGKAAPTSGCASREPDRQARQLAVHRAPPPVKPGTSTVTATVHVVFALQ